MTTDLYKVAFDNLGVLQSKIDLTSYEDLVAECHDIICTLFMSVAKDVGIDLDTIKPCETVKINDALLKVNVDLGLDIFDKIWVTKMYFTNSALGVVKEDFVVVLEIMYTILDRVNDFRNDRNLYTNTIVVKFPK